MDLVDKVALVTGAGRGLGWGIAVALAQAGARVCVTDIDEVDVGRAVRDIEARGGTARGAVLDVTDRERFEAVTKETLSVWGRLDVFVHSAIFMPLARFEDVSDASWQRQLDVGLGGFYHGIRSVWPALVAAGGGHLIGVASGSSVRGYVDEVAYCTIKHAQEGMVKALALEGERRGIAINTMGPGAPIKPTRMTWDELEATPAAERAAWADPVELGRGFAWLASQPPARFSGLRFDAGRIVETLDREGEGFAFEVDKVTIYPDDFRARMAWRADYPGER